MKKIFFILLLMPVLSMGQQSSTKYLIETPIGQTEKQTFLFLKGVLNGIDPAKKYDNNWGSYDLDNINVHIEYKIENDTCIIAVAHYKTDVGEYERVQKEIRSNATLQNGLITKLSDSGEMLVYDFNSKEKVISVFRQKYIYKVAGK